VEGWLEIVRTFDVDLLKGMSVGVFPLQYTSVRDVEAALRAVATGEAAAPTAPGAPAGAAALASLPRHPLLGALRVIPLERLNSLLVVTPRAAYLDEVKLWIERLDRPSETEAEPRLFVYPVQNGSATHLATVLNGIFGGGSSAAGVADAGVAPGLRPVTGATAAASRTGAAAASLPLSVARSGTASGLGSGALPQTGTRAAGGTGAGVAAVSLGGNVRIVGDDLNNAVLIYAPPSEFRKIEETLKRLDMPATQVLIEATIVEVTLADELQYGLQWYFSDSPRGGLRGAGQLNLNNQGDIRPIQPGFAYTLTNSLGQVRAVLNALADRSLIRVISSPSLMVLDNHTAAISVGDQQPIRSSESITEGGLRTTSIEYKDTGVLLTVTPSVNSGDVVSMSINQAVTDVGGIDSATGQRAFLQRQIGSRVAVRSGEALVLGGLIKDNTTGGSSGVPFLSSIPILGALFGTKTQSIARTELLVVITPRVIRTAHDAREVSQEMRERMRGFRTLVEEQRGLLPKAFVEKAPPETGSAPPRETGRP
jgi:general secretion pathway protein D